AAPPPFAATGLGGSPLVGLGGPPSPCAAFSSGSFPVGPPRPARVPIPPPTRSKTTRTSAATPMSPPATRNPAPRSLDGLAGRLPFRGRGGFGGSGRSLVPSLLGTCVAGDSTGPRGRGNSPTGPARTARPPRLGATPRKASCSASANVVQLG